MNRMKFVIAAFAIGMIASVGSTANANPPSNIDCRSVTGGTGEFHNKLVDLCDATQRASFTKPQDQDGLEGKILGAGTKVDQNKLSDAEKKLRDFEINLLSLMSTCPKKIACQGGAEIQTKLNDAVVELDKLQ